MYQVSVEYVKEYGKEVGRKHHGKGTDGQTNSKPTVPSGETSRGLINGEERWKLEERKACIYINYRIN